MRSFLKCLKKNGDNHGKCKYLSKQYLQCRMERNLMKEEPFEELGFFKEDEGDTSLNVKTSSSKEGDSEGGSGEKKRSQGFYCWFKNVKGKAFRQLGEMARPPRPS